ncbi:MAG: sugar diacid recognition domain-containing protein [Tissierellia bacterium]|nr:sugar diacid recognition domain-containing protein [Tissierellia bacterium]
MYTISKDLAMKIVFELKNHINANFNFMDKSGLVIASVDAKRIGGMHLGAKEIIDKSLDMLYVYPEMEDDYTKEGINLALKVFGEIVGVVGITGKKEQVMPYATIVKKMTEIMIEDSIRKEDSRLKRHIKYRYIEDLIFDSSMVNKKEFISRGLELGIDIKLKRRAVILYLKNYPSLIVSLDGQRKIDSIDDLVREFADFNSKILYLYLPSHYTFFYNVDDYDIEAKLYQLSDRIKKEHGQDLVFGIGGVIENDLTYEVSYNQALKAKNLALRIDKKIVYYDELGLENYLFDIDMDKMNTYVKAFTKKIMQEDLEGYIALIEEYFKAEGAISSMAASMYLHKNTIQYRLQKLANLTGYDIRKPSQSIYYFFFLEFYRILTSI